MHNNHVPAVIDALEEWVRTKRSRTYIPPSFLDRDGSMVDPPPFEMPAYVTKKPEFFTQNIQQNKSQNEPNV